MKFQHLSLAASLLLGATCSQAATVTLHGFQFGYQQVQSAQFGTLYTGGFVGEYDNSASNTFITYCNDLYQSFNWNVSMMDYEIAATGSAHGLTDSQANNLGRLYTTAGVVDTFDESVAFQLAVWELTHDTTPGDLLAGTFSVDSGTSDAQMALAQAWLANAVTTGGPNGYTVTRLYSPTTQDFLLVEASVPPASKVPEPSALLLGATALLGMLTLRSRRQQVRSDSVD